MTEHLATPCTWPGSDPLMIHYHNEEWGVPVHDDQKWFEFIVLDTFQAGLSWKTILHKRENFRKALDHFNPSKIAAYDENKIQSLMQDTGIIRNQAKIRATVNNAHAFLRVQQEFVQFDHYIWQFTGGQPIVNHFNALKDIPTRTDLSDQMSKDLTKRGFKFVGSVICYSFMQAAGMVNDHLVNCPYRFR